MLLEDPTSSICFNWFASQAKSSLTEVVVADSFSWHHNKLIIVMYTITKPNVILKFWNTQIKKTLAMVKLGFISKDSETEKG